MQHRTVPHLAATLSRLPPLPHPSRLHLQVYQAAVQSLRTSQADKDAVTCDVVTPENEAVASVCCPRISLGLRDRTCVTSPIQAGVLDLT